MVSAARERPACPEFLFQEGGRRDLVRFQHMTLSLAFCLCPLVATARDARCVPNNRPVLWLRLGGGVSQPTVEEDLIQLPARVVELTERLHFDRLRGMNWATQTTVSRGEQRDRWALAWLCVETALRRTSAMHCSKAKPI